MDHNDCSICAEIPDRLHRDFLEEGNPVEIPQSLLALHGWDGVDLSSGYQKFALECQSCHTRYLVEIDVEPFVWDLDVTRLVGPNIDYDGHLST